MKAVLVEKGGKAHEVDVENADVGAVVNLSRKHLLRVFRYSSYQGGIPHFHEVDVQVIDRIPGEGAPVKAPESPKCGVKHPTAEFYCWLNADHGGDYHTAGLEDWQVDKTAERRTP